MKTREHGAFSVCLATRTRRLVFFGALMLLGWVAAALASAASADAKADPGGKPPTTASTIHAVLAPAAPVLNDLRHVLGHPQAVAEHHVAGSAPVARQVSATVARHAAPVAAGLRLALGVHLPLAAPTGSPLERLPVVGVLAHTLGPITQPAPSGAAPAAGSPAAQQVDEVAQAPASAPPALLTVTAQVSLGPLAISIDLPISLDLSLTSTPTPPPPNGGRPTGVSPTPAPRTPRPAHPVHVLAPVLPVGNVHDHTPLAVPASTGLGNWPFVDAAVPAPTPHAPPAVPDIAFAASSGSAASSNPRSGSGFPSGCAAETWAAQQLQLLGPADSTLTRSVRDSATQPPVSPD